MTELTAAIIRRSGKILICRRAYGSCAHLWEFPGGKTEPGETPFECLVRELREELGVDAGEDELRRIACLRRTNSFCNVFVIKIDRPAEDFVLQKEEVSAVRWCDADRLMRMVADNTFYNYGDAYFRMLLQYQRTHR